MNTKDSLIVAKYTQAAINRFEEYLNSITDKENACVELRGDTLCVQFSNQFVPSEEDIARIRNIFFWTDTIFVPHIEGFVHYYPESGTLLVSLRHYELLVQVYEKLKELKVAVTSFDLSLSELTYNYRISGRSPLYYKELMEVHRILDPKEPEHLYLISVFRMGEEYSLTAKVSALESNTSRT